MTWAARQQNLALWALVAEWREDAVKYRNTANKIGDDILFDFAHECTAKAAQLEQVMMGNEVGGSREDLDANKG